MGKDAGLGSKAWADQLREDLHEAVDNVQTGYLGLAEKLYLAYDVPVGNDPTKPATYTMWGYKRFEDFAEEELGIERQRAYSLRRIWMVLETTFKDLDPGLRERLKKLGWTKVREVIKVATPKTAEKWIEKAEQSSYRKLADLVVEYTRAAKEKKKAADAKKAADSVAGASFDGPLPPPPPLTDPGPPKDEVSREPGEDDDEPQEESQGEPTQGVQDDLELEGQEADETVGGIPVEALASYIEAPDKVTFSFYPGQREVVEQALERAQELSQSDVKSHNITMICTEFLAMHIVPKKSAAWRQEMLTKLQTALGLDLIAIDPATKGVVYGLEAAQKVLAP